MLERYFVRPQTVDRIRALWLGPAIEQYVAWLTERRIASRHVLSCVATLEHFNTFAQGRSLQTWEELPAHLGAFVEQRLRDRGAWCRSPKDRRTVLSQARTPVVQLLRLVIPGFVGTTRRLEQPFHASVPEFFEYLQRERGLRPESIRQYVYHLRLFEAYLQRAGVRALADISPALLAAFLTEPGLRGTRLGPDSMQGRGGTLRVFLRYLHRQQLLATDLSRAVPRRRGYRQATLPRAITWGEVERVLAVVDRRTPVGKRDYAILLLLATYGLRAKDVASLRLEDIDWPRAQMHVTARKNGHSTIYPLATTVGHALVDYLKSGRPSVADRPIFLRAIAPFTPLPCSAIATRASHYLHLAGVAAPRAGSHTFRHTCVQRLVDADVPFKVIGDYVGHRSADSTQVYGKVAVHLLRQLALGDGEEVL
jgi:site-specific recombinase XerD